MNNQINNVVKELINQFGNSLNLRGVITGPPDNPQFDGKVIFNIINIEHPDFGKHSWHYSIDNNNKIRFFVNNQERDTDEEP